MLLLLIGTMICSLTFAKATGSLSLNKGIFSKKTMKIDTVTSQEKSVAQKPPPPSASSNQPKKQKKMPSKGSPKALPGQRIQTILILPGPHKTGTTSVQVELSNWLRDQHPAFSNWSWPVPSEVVWKNHTGQSKTQATFKFDQAKGHALLANHLLGHVNSKFLPHAPAQAVLEAYRITLQKDWEAGKSLVIAAEALDRIAEEVPL